MFIRLTAGKMGTDGSYNSQLEVRGKWIRQEGILGLKDKYRILRKGADGFYGPFLLFCGGRERWRRR